MEFANPRAIDVAIAIETYHEETSEDYDLDDIGEYLISDEDYWIRPEE